MKVLVTGSDGQLGQSLHKLSAHFPQLEFLYTDKNELDITVESEVESFIKIHQPNYCINAAAYTAVDRAEANLDRNIAAEINASGARNLAAACTVHNVQFIHISTDFVFDGKKSSPYLETDKTNPLGIYGKTKETGEWEVMKFNPAAMIIRTSWLYSEFGQNFVKTMLRLGAERSDINVVSDQIGCPTYAVDLAAVLLEIIISRKSATGVYHYSNEGVASWYDLAAAVFEIKQMACKVHPINTIDYPTPATRPSYSVLSKSKIKKTFGVEIDHWRVALTRCLSQL